MRSIFRQSGADFDAVQQRKAEELSETGLDTELQKMYAFGKRNGQDKACLSSALVHWLTDLANKQGLFSKISGSRFLGPGFSQGYEL